MRFDGKVALISGAARGMGASHARGFVAEGGRVVIGDVLEAEGKDLADALGDRATFVKLDVTVEHDWQEAVRATLADFGRLDVLVNNAGIVEYGTTESTSLDTFRRVIDVNLIGTFLGMHTAIPALREAGGGVIINISSTAGMMGYAGIAPYVASKWGVRGLTKSTAMEVARDGIRVVSVHPGPIRTPMTQGMDDDSLVATQAMPRMGEPEEVTRLVLFLASEATFSTGSEFIIDGGALLGPIVELQPQ